MLGSSATSGHRKAVWHSGPIGRNAALDRHGAWVDPLCRQRHLVRMRALMAVELGACAVASVSDMCRVSGDSTSSEFQV